MRVAENISAVASDLRLDLKFAGKPTERFKVLFHERDWIDGACGEFSRGGECAKTSREALGAVQARQRVAGQLTRFCVIEPLAQQLDISP